MAEHQQARQTICCQISRSVGTVPNGHVLFIQDVSGYIRPAGKRRQLDTGPELHRAGVANSGTPDTDTDTRGNPHHRGAAVRYCGHNFPLDQSRLLGNSRVLVHCAEEELANTVHGRVGGGGVPAMEAEFPGMPAHGAEQLTGVLWSSKNLRKQLEAVEGAWMEEVRSRRKVRVD